MNFLSMLRNGSEKVNKAYPRAKFLVAEAILDSKTAKKESDVHKWRLIFLTEDLSNTIFLYCEDSKFGTPELHPGGWVGVRAINMELIPRGMTHAFTRLQQQYKVNSFNAFALHWPLYPGVDQPYYVFVSGCFCYLIPAEKPDGRIISMME